MVTPQPPSASPRVARRRHVTVLFSDLSDSTTLAGSIQQEDYLDILDHLRSCVDNVLAKHGGTLVDVHGDGFLAMFGFPDASEYDGRHAIEAALELHEAIASSPIAVPPSIPRPLSMHSGIHSGLVLVIEEGYPSHFALVGEAPNIAARLSDAAQRNEILVSATTLGTERHFFELRDRHDLMLHGKSEPVPTFQVVGRAAVSRRYDARVRHGLTPFVGRAAETTVLERALEAAAAGHLQVVSIMGSPGIGKTRLAEEFLQRVAAGDYAVHRAYCDEHSAEPLQPIRQMLRAASARLPSGNPTVALREWFSLMAAARPLVIFIDDWQWADDATRTALAAVRELDTSRILILTTSRLSDLDDAQHVRTDHNVDYSEIRVMLSPLDEAAAEETIKALRPEDPPSDVREVKELAGGNPLYIEELCHGATTHLADRAGDRKGSRPAWLNTVIESRVARLPSDQADIVRAAAMIGMVVPGWLLQQLTGHGDDDPAVRSLAERDLIFGGEAEHTLRFKHGITREVIYQSLGLRWRQQKHLEIAELLEKHHPGAALDDQLEALAYHYRAAARTDRAAEYAERAGDKALAAAALDRARTQYTVALDLLDPAAAGQYARWIAIAQRFGFACVYDPDLEHLPILQRAVDLAAARGDDNALARTQYWLGYMYYALGKLGLGIEHLQRAQDSCVRAMKRLLANGSADAAVELDAHAVQVLAVLGQARGAAGEFEGVLDQLDEAIEIKRRHRRGTRPALGSAYAFACRGAVLGNFGRFREAHESFAEGLDALRGSSPPVKGSMLDLQGLVFTWQQRWPEALACGTEAQQIGERIESLYILAISQTLRGYARWKLERTTDAIDAIVRAVSWLEARDKRLYISVSYAWLAEAMLDVGRHAEARAHAARAIRRARQRDRIGEALAYRVMARMPEQYRRRPAQYYVDRALASARWRHSPHEEALALQVADAVRR